MYLYVFVSVCTCVCRCPQNPEKGIQSLGVGIIGTCKLSDMGGSAGIHTLILMIEQRALLAAVVPLQQPVHT